MKVASYLNLKNVDETDFILWIESLPVKVSKKQLNFLLWRSNYRRAVLWTNKTGFQFFD